MTGESETDVKKALERLFFDPFASTESPWFDTEYCCTLKKTEARQHIKWFWRLCPPSEKAAREKVATHFLYDFLANLPYPALGQNIAIYQPLADELDVFLHLPAKFPQKTFCWPTLVGQNIEFQSGASKPNLAPASIGLFVVPALGVTEDGVRLGRGRGYYDRLFSQPALAGKLKICILPDFARLPELATDLWDQSVDFCFWAGVHSGLMQNFQKGGQV